MLCIKCGLEIDDDSVCCKWCGWMQNKTLPKRKVKSRGNGQGSVYQLPNGKYKAEVVLEYFPDENGKLHKKRRTKVFDRRKDAVAAIPELLNHVEVEKVTFKSLYEMWSQKHFANLSDSKITAYKIAYNKCTVLYYRNLLGIKLVDLQTVVDTNGTSYYTKRDIKVLFNQMWKYAIQNDFCDKNYAEYIELPQLEKSNKDSFTDIEIRQLWEDYEKIDEVGKREHPFTGYILVMIYTGMRYGEISLIKKEDIFLEQQYMIGGIKTNAGKDREILICDKIKPIIAECLSHTKKKLLEMNEDNFRAKYKETLTRASIRALSPHCCRHTTATALALAGVAPAIIKDIMGHENYSTTIGYTHIKLNEKLTAINKI